MSMTEKNPAGADAATVDVDTINLEQALIDFEIANSRVVDLTRRLTSMSQELMRVRSELSDTQLRLSQAEVEKGALQRRLAEMSSSLAYRVARGLGDGRAKLVRR